MPRKRKRGDMEARPNPVFHIVIVDHRKEILRVASDGRVIPAQGLSLSEAWSAMVAKIDRVAGDAERKRCLKILNDAPNQGTGIEDFREDVATAIR